MRMKRVTELGPLYTLGTDDIRVMKPAWRRLTFQFGSIHLQYNCVNIYLVTGLLSATMEYCVVNDRNGAK